MTNETLAERDRTREELDTLQREWLATDDTSMGYRDARENYLLALADAYEGGELVTRAEVAGFITETLAERLEKCVKQLEFCDGKAHCDLGLYVVDSGQSLKGRWHAWALNFDDSDPFFMWHHGTRADSEEAAKAAAQADYTARVLAALDLDAIARLVTEAVEEDRAEFHCEECDLPSYLCEARCFVRNAIKVHGEEKTWESIKEYFLAIRARADQQTEGE